MKRTCSTLLLLLCAVILLSCKRDRSGFEHTHEDEQQVNVIQNNQVTIIGTPDTSVVTSHYEMTDSSLCIYGYPIMTDEVPNQILSRIAYATSYNNNTKCPNWVSWHLTSGHTDGPYPRNGVPYYSNDGIVEGIGNVTQETCRNGYFVDLDANEPRQQLSDWTREYNMSHGHMCPAGDNKWDKAAMNQSFLLTNMCPQDEKLNGGGWKKLEEKCRTWANQYGSIYIVAGPIFNESITRTLGEGKIAVPDAFFKVVLCLEGTPKAIGFFYKNDSSSQSIRDCACSVDNIEELTGLDFFYSLPDDIENIVESDSNLSKWN